MSKLGEVFVEILGDADPFAEDFASALGQAGEAASGELTDALDGVTGDLEEQLTDAGVSAGEGLTEGLGGAASEAADLVTSELDGIDADVSIDVDVDVDPGAFEGISDAASSAADEAVAAFDGMGDEIAGEIGAGVDEASGALDGLMGSLGSLQGALTTAAGGAGLEGFARSQADSNVTLARMADRIGESEDALRGSIDGMTDWTFSSHDAAAGMELLSQRGVDNLEAMEELLPAWDDFADATGQDFVKAMDDGQRALGAFGIPAEDAAENMDTLTFLTNEIDVPLDRLSRQIRGNEEDLAAMGLGLDESAGLLAALQAKGMDGRDAVALFGRAVKGSEGDLDDLLGELGLTADEFETYTGKVGEAEGITSKQADQANSVATPMERLGGVIENLGFRFGGLGQIAGMVAAPLGSLGPIMFGINQAGGMFAKVGPMMTKALGGLGKAFAVLGKIILANPLFLIVAAVVAIIAIVWHFRDEIMAAIGAAWEWLKDATSSVWEWLTDLWSGLVDMISGAWTAVLDWFRGLPGRILSALGGLASTVWNFIVENHPIALLWRAMTGSGDESESGVMSWLLGLPGRIVEWIGGLATVVWDFIKEWNPISMLWRAITGGGDGEASEEGLGAWFRELPGKIIGWLQELPGQLFQFILEWHPLAIMWRLLERFFPDIAESLRGFVGDVIGWFTELATNVVEIVSGWFSDVVGFYSRLWDRAVEIVTGIRDAVVEWFLDLVLTVATTVAGWVDDLIGFVTNLWNEWVSLVHGIRDAVVGAISGMVETVVSTVSGWVTDLIGFVTGLRDDFIDRIGDLVDGAVDWFRELPGRILGALGDLGTLLWDVGKDIIGGLVGGIKDVAMAPVKAVRDVGSSIVSGIGGFLGISSPSKLMADEIGGPIMDGVAVGIHDHLGGALAELERFANEASSAGDMGAIFREEDLGTIGNNRPGRIRPADIADDPRGAMGGVTWNVEQTITGPEPIETADESMRRLRELATMGAPFDPPEGETDRG